MKTVTDEKIGDVRIQIVARGSVYQGRVSSKERRGDVLEGSDHQQLLVQLRNEAGKLHPNYFGMEGAVSRFLHFFPSGFNDRAFDLNERDYKIKAREKLIAALPLDRAVKASADEAVAVRPAFNTNVLSRFELARVHALLGSEQGPAFVRAAARFAHGEIAAGLGAMVAAIAPHGRHSWPMMTYLPNLWLPNEHMFLKPNATLDFAQRIGHRFQFDYSAEASATVYESLLDLVATTEAALSTLKPQSRIDVQSFIWIVGDYKDSDLALLNRLRASA